MLKCWNFNISTFRHFNISTCVELQKYVEMLKFQHFNISTCVELQISTFQHINISTFQHFNMLRASLSETPGCSERSGDLINSFFIHRSYPLGVSKFQKISALQKIASKKNEISKSKMLEIFVISIFPRFFWIRFLSWEHFGV